MRTSVLIIEDEEALRRVYEFVLLEDGFDVQIAENGEDGIQKLQEKIPDIILLDLYMPIMNGWDFLKSIDFQMYPDMKIIIYTNLLDRSLERELLQLGAERYVIKSSSGPDDLLKLVHEVANKS